MFNRYLRKLQDFRKSKSFAILSPVLRIISKRRISLCLPQLNLNIFMWAFPVEILFPKLSDVWQNGQSSSPWAPQDCLWASLPIAHTFVLFQDPLSYITALLSWAPTGHLLLQALTWPHSSTDSSSIKKDVNISWRRKGVRFGINISLFPLLWPRSFNSFRLFSVSTTFSLSTSCYLVCPTTPQTTQSLDSGARQPGLNLALILTSFVTLGKLFILSLPQSSHL